MYERIYIKTGMLAEKTTPRLGLGHHPARHWETNVWFAVTAVLYNDKKLFPLSIFKLFERFGTLPLDLYPSSYIISDPSVAIQ